MRTSDSPMDPNIQNEMEMLLPQVIADIKTTNEAKLFLKDFLSPKEKEVFSKRLAILYWLKRGRTYNQIKSELKVSSATIATTHTINDKPGIATALKILEANQWASKMSDRIRKIVGK